MFLPFFQALRAAGVPVSLREHLTFLGALDASLAEFDVDNFYFLARTTLVKNEAYIDRFDRAFGQTFQGVEAISYDKVLDALDLPEDWLRSHLERNLTDAEKAEIEALGGFEKLMETLRKRLEEQRDRHQGGSKWIGTGGTSPFGANGYNPEGVRIRQDQSRHQRATKVWDKRMFKDFGLI